MYLSSQLSNRARESKVPATRISRLVNFGGTTVFLFCLLLRLLLPCLQNVTLHFVLFQVSVDTFEICLTMSQILCIRHVFIYDATDVSPPHYHFSKTTYF